jgi:hypothetical protein
MRNRRPRIDAAVIDRSDSVVFLASVADDFAALAALFQRQLGEGSLSDEEMRLHVANANAAADRGRRLCEELLGRLQSSSESVRTH